MFVGWMPIWPGITCVRIHVYMFVRMTIVIRTNIYIYIYTRVLTHTYYHDLLRVDEAVCLEDLDDIVRELECLVIAGGPAIYVIERSYDLWVGTPLHRSPMQSR